MKRHDTDVASLVFGLLFLGVSAMWPLVHFDVLGLPGLEVAAPVLLVSVGLAGLVASLGRMRRDRDEAR
jgi:protein-S-isoprenylcysteine O-methyltransferase Ste14